LVLVLACMPPAHAGYNSVGYTPQVVASQTGVVNAAASFLVNPLWNVSGLNDSVTTSFVLPACQDIDFARLYFDVWGGTADYTAQLAVTVNGTTLPSVALGGTGNAAPTFNAQTNCAYGSGYGWWQVGMSGVAGLLHTNGVPNEIGLIVTDPGNNFDGRVVDAALVSVYQAPSLLTKLDFYLAEGDGSLRNTPGSMGTPADRYINFTGIDTNHVTSALYLQHYTYGSLGQTDWLYFNGTQLGGDDVAYGAMGTYGPDMATNNVTSLLSPANLVHISVNDPSGEATLKADAGLLVITHVIPEPSAVACLATGTFVVLLQHRRRRSHTTSSRGPTC
jgi:hypothetical protein